MSEVLYWVMGIIAKIHNYIMHLNDKFEYNFSDKDMHFLVIGLLGMLMIFVVYPLFKWLAQKKHIMVIAWIYVFTLILVITFAIEIGQKISNTGNMEFADIVLGIMGFIVMFAIFAVFRGIYHGIRWLFSHRFVKKDSASEVNDNVNENYDRNSNNVKKSDNISNSAYADMEKRNDTINRKNNINNNINNKINNDAGYNLKINKISSDNINANNKIKKNEGKNIDITGCKNTENTETNNKNNNTENNNKNYNEKDNYGYAQKRQKNEPSVKRGTHMAKPEISESNIRKSDRIIRPAFDIDKTGVDRQNTGNPAIGKFNSDIADIDMVSEDENNLAVSGTDNFSAYEYVNREDADKLDAGNAAAKDVIYQPDDDEPEYKPDGDYEYEFSDADIQIIEELAKEEEAVLNSENDT
jgi:hypothetical protein